MYGPDVLERVVDAHLERDGMQVVDEEQRRHERVVAERGRDPLARLALGVQRGDDVLQALAVHLHNGGHQLLGHRGASRDRRTQRAAPGDPGRG